MESNPDIVGSLISSLGTETLSPNLDLESDLQPIISDLIKALQLDRNSEFQVSESKSK